MSARRGLPSDFTTAAVTLTNRQLMERYGVCQPVISRWRRETGAPTAGASRYEQLPPPDDFAAVAAGKSKRELVQHYGHNRRVIDRWVAVTNAAVQSKPGTKPGKVGTPEPVPADFAKLWAEMSQLELSAHYGCHHRKIADWVRTAGLKRPPRVRAVRNRSKPAAKLMVSRAPVTVLRTPRDTSTAGQAADYLRRYGPVARCDADGRYAENGTHYRRNNTVLTPTEIIERAERLGFDPNAWPRLAA